MSMTQQQSLHYNSKGQGESIQTRLALLSHLTEKQEGSSIYKKKTFFWDQEHMYSENLMLKAQVKQLTQANTKSRTTILEMEAEMKQKQSKNNEHDLKQSALRSMSLRNLGKKSMIVFRPSLQEEGKSKSIRQIIRELKEEIAALKNEKEIMKRSLKYTRMSQLQTLNKEMDLELQRLNRLVNENKNKYYALALEMEALNEVLKKERLAKQLIGQERDKIRKELARARNDNNDYQKRIQLSQKQSRNQIRKLRSINPEIAVLNTESAAKTLGKLNSQSFKSIPKLDYSISGLQRIQNDTINFDKLLNSESQLRSIPKISSLTSLELQKMSFKNDGNSPEKRVKTSEKVESCSEMENLQEEAYEFEDDEVEVEEVKKIEEPKVEDLYEQDETQFIKQVEEKKVKEESKQSAKKSDKQKNEPITDDFFEEKTPKIKQQAQKPKIQPKQEDWEQDFEELQEYDDPVKEVVKPVKNEKPEELFQDFDVESFEPVQEPKKQEPVQKQNPIVKSTKQQPEESFEEDDAEIIQQIEQPLPQEKIVESNNESKQHQPVVSTTQPLRQEEEEVKEQKVQSNQHSSSPAPFKYEFPKSLLAIEAEKQQPVSFRPMQALANEAKEEEIANKEVKLEVKTQVKPEVKEQLEPEVNIEVKPQVKTEVTPEVKNEVKVESKNKVKNDVKVEVKEVKIEVKNEVKREVKVQVKEEVKKEVNKEVKEEVKKQVKEEVLEEVQEEVKEESVYEDLMVQEEI